MADSNNNGASQNGAADPAWGAMAPQAVASPFGAEEDQGVNPLTIVLRAFRGRYVWAVIMGVVFAAPLALIGYQSLPPKFTSNALIIVRSRVETVVYDLRGSEEIRNINPIVNEQALNVQQQRVVSMAVDQLRVKHPWWPLGGEGLRAYYKGMNVKPSRNSSVVSVSFSHTEPRVARDAVNALINSYETIYVDESERSRTSLRSERLETLVGRYDQDIADVRRRLTTLEQEYGTLDLRPLQSERSERLAALNETIRRLEAEKRINDSIENDADPRGRIADPMAGIQEADLRRAAEGDDELRTLLSDRLFYETRLRGLAGRFGPEHREVKQLTARLDTMNTQIRDRFIQLQGDDAGSIDPAQLNAAQIEDQLARYRNELNLLNNELQNLAKFRMDIAKAQALEQDLLGSYDIVQTELRMLRAETEGGANLSRIQTQPGELPFAPSTDRRAALAGIGAVGGIGLGFLIVGAIGFLRLGVEYISDLDELGPDAPLVGVIPDLDSAGIEDSGAAGQSVHHLRNLLQVRRAKMPRGCRIYTVTSPTSGDGKTSLTSAIAMSFAAVGHKTLAIDADMIGHGLSKQFGLAEEPGLWQSLEGERLDRCAHETESQNLWVMPTGAARQSEPERMGRDRLGELMVRLRDDFDTIIIDTGPLLGSLDASLGVSAGDEALLVIGRGQRPKLVQSALERLKSLGGDRVNVVFNRARWEDLETTSNGVSLNSQSFRSQNVEEPEHGRSTRARRSLTSASTKNRGGVPKL